MGRTLVFGDIHGGLRALQEVLQMAKVIAEDELIFLGDYVDGWSESAGVIDFLMALEQQHKKTIFIRGNHDDLVQQWLEGKSMSPIWMKHGGQSTINSYKLKTAREIEQHIAFYKTFKDYHIDAQNRMYCHAGFQNLNGPEHEWHSTAFYWDRTLWEMVCAMREDLNPDDLFYPKRLKLFSEIFIGHTPTTRINQSTPVNKANVWNLDTGAAFKGRLSVMDVASKKFWQSTPLTILYPGQNGRN